MADEHGEFDWAERKGNMHYRSVDPLTYEVEQPQADGGADRRAHVHRRS